MASNVETDERRLREESEIDLEERKLTNDKQS